MAMNAEAGGAAPAPAPPVRSVPGREGAPAWVVPLYVGGLIVLYLGGASGTTIQGANSLLSTPLPGWRAVVR